MAFGLLVSVFLGLGIAELSAQVPATKPTQPATGPSQVPLEPAMVDDGTGPIAQLGDQGTEAIGVPAESSDSVNRSPNDPIELLHRKWFERQRVLEVAEADVADNLLPALTGLRLDLGVKNFPSLSQALLREADRAAEKGAWVRVQNLIATAQELSPDFPQPHFRMAFLLLRRTPFAVGTIVHNLVRGISAGYATFMDFVRHVSNGALYLSWSLAIAVLVALATLATKYVGLLRHLLQHILIARFPGPLGLAITLGFLLLPIILRMGWSWAFLFWAFLMLPFARPAERIFLSLLICGIAVLPYCFPSLIRFSTARLNADYELAVAMTNQTPRAQYEELRTYAREADPDGAMAFAVGYLAKKREQYSLAKESYEQALKNNFHVEITNNNLGNVVFALGDPKTAVEHYKKAAALSPTSFYPEYNLGQAYYEMKEVRPGTDALANAKAKDSDKMNYYQTIKTSHFNRLLADEEIPGQTLFNRLYLRAAPRKDLEGIFWATWMFPLAPDGMPFFLMGCVVLLAAGWILGSVLTFPCPCAKCGEAACQWCFVSPKRPDLCSQCFYLFVRKESVDPASRDQKEAEILIYERRRKKTLRLLSIFAPGSAQIMQGRIFRGCFLLVFFGVLLCLLFNPDGYFVSGVRTVGAGQGFRFLLLVAVIATVYIRGLLSAAEE